MGIVNVASSKSRLGGSSVSIVDITVNRAFRFDLIMVLCVVELWGVFPDEGKRRTTHLSILNAGNNRGEGGRGVERGEREVERERENGIFGEGDGHRTNLEYPTHPNYLFSQQNTEYNI